MKRSVSIARSVTHSTLRALNHVEELGRLQARGRCFTVGDVWEDTGSYRSIFKRIDCGPEHGVEILGQTDIFSAEPLGRVVRGDLVPDGEARTVRPGMVLVAAAGQMGDTDLFGRVVWADARLAGKMVSSDVLALAPRKDTDPAIAKYTFAWALSGLGLRLIRSAAYGTSIPCLRMDLLSRVPVPLADAATVQTISGLIDVMIAQRERFLRELLAARAVIEALPEMSVATEICRVRSRRCVTWPGALATFTAWTFASAGTALEHLLRTWGTTWADVVEEDGVFNGPRFARIPCTPPHGVDFLSQRDAFLMRPIPRRIVRPNVPDRLLFSRENTILMGGHGALGEREIFGRAVLLTGTTARKAFTQDLLRIWASPDVSRLLFSFVSTLVGFRLVRTTAVGTKLMTLRPDLLRALPFPVVSSDVQRAVNKHVDAASEARAAAEVAENTAIRLIEEEVLPRWLT